MREWIRGRGVFFLLTLLAFLYGVAVGRFQFPPFSLLKDGYSLLQPKDSSEIQYALPSKTPQTTIEVTEEYIEIPKEYSETDVESLIAIRSQEDVAKQREILVRFLWGDGGLPSSLPSTVIKDFKDVRYEDIPSLVRLDKIVITMEFGIESIAYHFVPQNPNNKVVLYHQGHDGDFFLGKKEIETLIEHGYAVMAFSMPLLGLNNQPTIQITHIGKLKLTSHDHMKFLFPQDGHPVKYFIEPVVIALNYIETKYNYTSIAMAGLSGGGWTTTLSAAVDTRIKKSFPVAGSYPIYLRSNSPNDWGDYEQTIPELYTKINYLELYILGAHGENRKQIQIINKYDPCCFNGINWETYLYIVKSHVHELGTGEFELLLDDSHRKHIISDFAMSIILHELE